jgi:hypothetical protein
MKKLQLFLPAILLVCSLTHAQTGSIRILYKSTDIANIYKDTLAVKSVHSAIWSDSLIVKLQNKLKLTMAPESIWGYQSKDGIVYRYYKGEFFEVRQMDSLYIYSRSRINYRFISTDYYFSKGSDGKIFDLTVKNLRAQFSENSCFVEKIENGFKWYQDYSSFDKTKREYRMIELYKSCTTNKSIASSGLK